MYRAISSNLLSIQVRSNYLTSLGSMTKAFAQNFRIGNISRILNLTRSRLTGTMRSVLLQNTFMSKAYLHKIDYIPHSSDAFASGFCFQINRMSEKEMNSYRFLSGQEPSDEMLNQIMIEVAEDAMARQKESRRSLFLTDGAQCGC